MSIIVSFFNKNLSTINNVYYYKTPNIAINSFFIYDNTFYIGGYFNLEINNITFNGLLRYKINSDELNDGYYLPIGGINEGYIGCFAVFGDILYFGGSFTK